MALAGFDVSGNSGNVDFAKAKAAGMRFCFARVGRGVPSSHTNAQGLDDRWQVYRAAATAAGLPVGGYWRFYTSSSVDVQVGRFAQALAQTPGMLPPLVDIEDAGSLSPAALTDWSVRVLDATHRLTGRRPLLYTGQNFLKTKLQQWRLDRWGRCVADWSATAWPDHSAVFWQRKGDVPAPWAQGNVDLQSFAGRPADLTAHTYEHQMYYWVDEDGQLYGPRAVWTPLPEGDDDPQSRTRQAPRRMVLHTMVGWLNGTDTYFRSAPVGTESTFGTGHTIDATKSNDPALDGQIRQWVECDVIANANLDGDRGVPDIVSWESSDGGQAISLSPKQVATTIQTMAAVAWRYGIPAVELADSCEGRSGIGWHRLGVPGWPVTGRYRGKKSTCEAWSAASGKECPRNNRIDQMVTTVIPTTARVVGSVRTPGAPVAPPPIPELEDTMVPMIRVLAPESAQRMYYPSTGRLVAIVNQDELQALVPISKAAAELASTAPLPTVTITKPQMIALVTYSARLEGADDAAILAAVNDLGEGLLAEMNEEDPPPPPPDPTSAS